MPLENAIFTQLSGFAALTALVPSTRIGPAYIAQGIDFPAVTYQRISTTPVNDWQQVCGENVIVQVSAWADTLTETNNVAAQIRAAMAAFAGDYSGFVVRSADLVQHRHFFIRDSVGGKGTHHMPVDFRVYHG